MNTRLIVHGTLALVATSAALLAFGCSSESGNPDPTGGGGSPSTSASTTSSSSSTTSSTGAEAGGGGTDAGGGGSNAGGGGSSAGGGGGAPVNNDDYVYPADATVDGKTYAQYAADWWTWALSIEGDMNPVIDDGPCDQAQPADVFFLAGNTGGASTRSCTVSATKPLFFPVINTFSMACVETVTDCSKATGQHMIDNASAAYTTPPNMMKVEIDGVSLNDIEQYYALTDAFPDPRESDDADQPFATDCTGPVRANNCGVDVGSDRPLAASGYWILVKPLSVGSHVVHFQGKVPGFSLNVTYNLTVQ